VHDASIINHFFVFLLK